MATNRLRYPAEQPSSAVEKFLRENTTRVSPDPLMQTGRKLRKTRENIRHSTRDIARNYALVEGGSDIVGAINTFRFEFRTYTPNPFVSIDIVISQKFQPL